MEQKQQQTQTNKVSGVKKEKARNISSDEIQQQQCSSQSHQNDLKNNITLQHTLKEILGVKNKPTANQSALFDKLVCELSSVASLTNNPNTISYSRDKSMTTDTTLSNNKLFLPGGISTGEISGGAELSNDTEGQANSCSSSYEDCSSSVCSCQDCQNKELKEPPLGIPLRLITDQRESPQKLKLEEQNEELCNLTSEMNSEVGAENDQKINEMNDDVFNELVAYSYLAGLATAQMQKNEGEIQADVDLNDTQFIERSLYQYEKWQQSFLNNTLVHEAQPCEIEEIPPMVHQLASIPPEKAKILLKQAGQGKVINANEDGQMQDQKKSRFVFTKDNLPELPEMKDNQFTSDAYNIEEVDSILFQEYYKQISANQGKKGWEQQMIPISMRTMSKEEKKDSKLEQKQQQLRLGEQLFDMFAKSRAEYLTNLDKTNSKPGSSTVTNEGDSADEPLPPVDDETRDCFVQASLVENTDSLTRHIANESSDQIPLSVSHGPIKPRDLNDEDLYQLAEFDDCEGIQSVTGYPFNFTKHQWLKADKTKREEEVSFDAIIPDISKGEGIAQNLSASNFAQNEEIRDLVKEMNEEDKKVDQLLGELDKNIFAPTDFDDEGAAQLLNGLTEEEHDFLLREKEKPACKCGEDDHIKVIQDQEKLFMERKDLKMMLDVERNLYKMLQYSSEDDQNAAKADSEGDDEPYAPNSFEIDAIAGLSLKQLETFMIQGDLRRCVVCNSQYANKDDETRGNLPRVLFCGDCICELCIVKHTQKASIQDKRINGAASQLICPVCNYKHIFKLTTSGFVVGNDNYIKFLDDRGPVNFFPGSKISEESSIKMLTELSKGPLVLMDHSISIPSNLILRSLPINNELLELLNNERDCGEPNQSNKQLRGLYHLVLDGTTTQNQEKPQQEPVQPSSPQNESNNKRDLKESAKQLKKQIQNLQHSQPDEEIKLDEEECAPPQVNTILQRKDDDDIIKSLKPIVNSDQTEQQHNLQNMLKSLAENKTKGNQPQEVVTNLADWFLQSKHAILNKGSIKEHFDTDSSNSLTSNNSSNSDHSGHIMPGKRKKHHLQYKVYLGSSNSSKSTFKHTGNHHIAQGLQVGNLSPKGAETLLSQSISSSIQHISDKSSLRSKRKLRERRKLRQQMQQANQNSSMKKGKYSGPLFGPIDNDFGSSLLIDNRTGEMSPDSADDTIDMYQEQTVQNEEKQVSDEERSNKFIGPHLMGEGEQRSATSPNPREPKSSALPQDLLPPPNQDKSLDIDDIITQSIDMGQNSGYAIQAEHDKQPLKHLILNKQKGDVPFPLEAPFPVEALDFLQKKETDKEFQDIIKQYFNIKQKDEAPIVAEKQWKNEIEVGDDSASKKKARRNKKKRKKILQQQILSNLQQQGTQISENNQKDMLTELVLIGEETIEGDELRFRTVYKDFFDYRPLDAESCADEVQVSLKGMLGEEKKEAEKDEIKEQLDLSDLKLSMTCILCCQGAPAVSMHTTVITTNTDGNKSISFGKQDLNLIKEMIEVGITTISTHICIHCSIDRMETEFWSNLDWTKKTSQPFGCTLCLVCSIKHKHFHSKITSAAKFTHQQNPGLNQCKELGEQVKQLHQMKPLLPSSHFQLLQKRDQKKTHFSNLIDHHTSAYFEQATNEEYTVYLTQVMNKLKIYKDQVLVPPYLDDNLQTIQKIDLEPEQKETKKNKKKKAGRNNGKK